MNEYTRKNSLRKPGYHYSQPGLYFITICTHQSEMLFGRISNGAVLLTDYGKTAERELLRTAGIWHIVLDAYTIMPNHLHFIAQLNPNVAGAVCAGTEYIGAACVGVACVGAACQPPASQTALQTAPNTVPNTTSQMPKTNADRSKQIIPAMICRYKGAVTKAIGFSLWQRSYYDNIIHGTAEYEKIKCYIKTNPATWEKDRFYCTE